MSNDVTKLAHAFCGIIRSWLTSEELAEVVSRNATPQYREACASHDFCDSNQAMLDAWEELFGEELDLQSCKAMKVVTRAWEMARSTGFAFIEPGREVVAPAQVFTVEDAWRAGLAEAQKRGIVRSLKCPSLLVAHRRFEKEARGVAHDERFPEQGPKHALQLIAMARLGWVKLGLKK